MKFNYLYILILFIILLIFIYYFFILDNQNKGVQNLPDYGEAYSDHGF
jgi:hypothetical protein